MTRISSFFFVVILVFSPSSSSLVLFFACGLGLVWLPQSSLALPSPSSSQQSQQQGATAVSPVSSWDPSWAASSVQGTTVAVSFGKKINSCESLTGCVILLRSSSSSSSSSFSSSRTLTPTSTSAVSVSSAVQNVDGLNISAIDTTFLVNALDKRRRASGSNGRQRWAWLGPNNLVFMTGLASDVDHLISMLQRNVDDQRIIYEGSDHLLSPLHLARKLSQTLYENTQSSTSARPFGVQCLLLGLLRRPQLKRPSTSSFAQDHHNHNIYDVCLLTLDPSGGYRHWGMATAIGRAADKVRQQLYQRLVQRNNSNNTTGDGSACAEEDSSSPSSSSCPSINATEALCLALNATAAALPDENAHYDAILLWKEEGETTTNSHYGGGGPTTDDDSDHQDGHRHPLRSKKNNVKLCLGIIDPRQVQAIRDVLAQQQGGDNKAATTPVKTG